MASSSLFFPTRHWMMFLALAGLLAVGPAQADREQEREHFRQGWAAAARGDQAATLDAILKLKAYPLTPYLEFELLRQRLDQVPEVVIEQFLARHRDWSFAAGLELAWLRSLARRGDYEALARHGRQSRDTEVRCHLARADLNQGRTEGLIERAEELWSVGRSQSSACDPLFAWWRRQGGPDSALAWRRFHLALNAGETTLARYLRRYLDNDQRHWADQWLALQARPYPTLRQARQWHDHPQSRLIVQQGIQRLARSDWQRAAEAWQLLEAHFEWAEADRSAIAREIALFQAVALDEGALAAIDALPAGARDQQILEWRARAAMAHSRWDEVLASIQAMGLVEQGQARWRYWRGRALAETGRPEALLAFGSLSSEATYYGFLSALRLGQDLNLCEQPLSADPAIQRRLMRDAEFERAIELFHAGLNGHARRTWLSVSRRLSRSELDQAALLAAGEGWHERAIAALGQSGSMRAYPWRFPMLEKGQILNVSQRWQVDPALVYGLMRAESAMQPDALSPAGARGLLQLMPTTASAVARRNQLPYHGQTGLMDPSINIPLGVAHLAELQQRYDGRWIHVAAAYNAGAGAVERWLDSRPFVAPDVWLETLPFFETRDYVPRVLAFATIYEWQMQRQPEVLPTHIMAERNGAAGFACTH
jgi:soluble lytic murein transglycosylase